MIANGMLADFVILSDDIVETSDVTENAYVLATYLDGECVYEK